MKKYFVKLLNEKLFLCSRDIQVGDKVNNDRRNIIGAEITSFDSNKTTLMLKGGNLKYKFDTAANAECFKVIGEISPDATWVTEWMEFDEEDIDIIYYHPEKVSGVREKGYLLALKKFPDFYQGYMPFARFRCPSSPKHFH